MNWVLPIPSVYRKPGGRHLSVRGGKMRRCFFLRAPFRASPSTPTTTFSPFRRRRRRQRGGEVEEEEDEFPFPRPHSLQSHPLSPFPFVPPFSPHLPRIPTFLIPALVLGEPTDAVAIADVRENSPFLFFFFFIVGFVSFPSFVSAPPVPHR